MKKILSLLALIPLLSSCVSMVYDARQPEVFTVIDNCTPYDIHYYQGSSHSIRVRAHHADLPYIKTIVVNGQLFVSYDELHHFHGTPYIEVYSPMLHQYNGRGHGDFRAKTAMNMNDVIFNMSGSGHARMDHMTAHSMDMHNTGSGDIKVKNGRVEGNNNINMGGSGRVTFNGRSQTTTVTNQGTGRVRGHVDTESFNGRSTNSGDINMRGKATTVTTKQESTGKTEYKRTGRSTTTQKTTTTGTSTTNRRTTTGPSRSTTSTTTRNTSSSRTTSGTTGTSRGTSSTSSTSSSRSTSRTTSTSSSRGTSGTQTSTGRR